MAGEDEEEDAATQDARWLLSYRWVCIANELMSSGDATRVK